MDTEYPAIFLNEYALGGHLTKEHFSVRELPGTDLETAHDDVAWARAALSDIETHGFAGLR